MPAETSNNIQTGAIVDAYSSGALLATKLREQGHRLIHIRTTKMPVVLWAHYTINTEDFFLDLYDEDPNNLVEELAKHNVSFVIAGTEPGVELADLLSEKLQLHSTNGTTLSKARRDKFIMINTIKQAGLKTTQQIQTASVNEAIAFAQSLPTFKVVLKPLRSIATDSVFEATNEQELRENFHKILSKESVMGEANEAVCVQEFIVGEEYIVDTVSCNGTVVVTDIWKYTKNKFNGVPFFYDYAEILNLSDPALTSLKEYTVKVVIALGIKWGPAHPEIMLTKDGPVVVEVGARMAGAGHPILVETAQDYGQMELTMKAYTDEAGFREMAEQPPQLLRANLWILLRTSRSGVIKSLDKLTEIEELPSFYRMKLGIKVGDILEKTIDEGNMPGIVFLAHEDRGVVMRDYATIRRLEAGDLYDVSE
jgi:hypothetical protein